MGVGSTFEQPLSSSSLKAESPMQHEDMPGMHHEGMPMAKPEITKDANSVPGFPQDAFIVRSHDGDGSDGRQTRKLWPASRLGRINGGNDNVRTRTPQGKYDQIMELKEAGRQ